MGTYIQTGTFYAIQLLRGRAPMLRVLTKLRWFAFPGQVGEKKIKEMIVRGDGLPVSSSVKDLQVDFQSGIHKSHREHLHAHYVI